MSDHICLLISCSFIDCSDLVNSRIIQNISCKLKYMNWQDQNETSCYADNCRKNSVWICSGCEIACYCSRSCQLSHWNNSHKDSCVVVKPSLFRSRISESLISLICDTRPLVR